MSNEKKRALLFGGISLLLVAGFAALLYFQHQTIEERRAEVATLKQSIEDDHKLLQKTPELVKQVIIQRETDGVIKGILSDEKDITDLVRTLNKFSQESGFNFASIKDGTRTLKKSKEDFERVSYSLAFDVDAFQLLTFLNKLESFTRFMSVTSLKLQAANRNEYTKDALPRHCRSRVAGSAPRT